MKFPSSFALLVAHVHVLVAVGHLHPFDVAEVLCSDGLGAMLAFVDDRLLFINDFVVRFPNEIRLIDVDIVAEDVVVHIVRS